MNDEKPDADAARDLLGDPIDTAHDTWGAPEFEKTKENQDLVTVLRAAGWTQERIARRVGCDPKTLRKHYSRELDEAADIVEAAALGQIMGRMGDGNIAAARKLLDLVEKGNAAVPLVPVPQPKDAAADAVPVGKLGKKAQQALDAQTPTAGWGEILGRVN